jgi:hypothetical protein
MWYELIGSRYTRYHYSASETSRAAEVHTVPRVVRPANIFVEVSYILQLTRRSYCDMAHVFLGTNSKTHAEHKRFDPAFLPAGRL